MRTVAQLIDRLQEASIELGEYQEWMYHQKKLGNQVDEDRGVRANVTRAKNTLLKTLKIGANKCKSTK